MAPQDEQANEPVNRPTGVQSSVHANSADTSRKDEQKDQQLDQSADAEHPRQPGEGPQTEKEAREAGEAPSDVNNEGAQNQGQVSQLDESEKSEAGNVGVPDQESPASSSDMPKEGTKPNREMDTNAAEDLDKSSEASDNK